LNQLICTPVQGAAIRCRIAASVCVQASPGEIAQWRRQPGQHGTEKLSPSFLKHAEDQTVVALTAVFMALREHGWHDRSFADWGIVAAPRFFGRCISAQSIQRFQVEGAWGVSPHLIPQHSLHAMSGTISQALQIHGPNLGVGAWADAFLVALAMLADATLPGVWLMLTGHESEWIPAPDGTASPPTCHGVALALLADETTKADVPATALSIRSAAPSDLADFDVISFAEELHRLTGASARWRLADDQWLELETEVGP
jgi:hypothetical protein